MSNLVSFYGASAGEEIDAICSDFADLSLNSIKVDGDYVPCGVDDTTNRIVRAWLNVAPTYQSLMLRGLIAQRESCLTVIEAALIWMSVLSKDAVEFTPPKTLVEMYTLSTNQLTQYISTFDPMQFDVEDDALHSADPILWAALKKWVTVVDFNTHELLYSAVLCKSYTHRAHTDFCEMVRKPVLTTFS